MDARTLLKTENLSRSYHGKTVVAGLDLKLQHGDILGLLGPNGAGKSTTLKMLAGILAPTGGVVQVLGKDLYRYPRQKRHIGYLAEQPPLYAELTLMEQLDFAGRLYALPKKLRQNRIEDVIEKCELENEQNRLIGQLSKGFRQRVGLAQSLLHEAQIIILDEPTDGLDPIQIQSFRSLIRRLSNSHAVLISSHQLGEISTICSHVLIMKQGDGCSVMITLDTVGVDKRFYKDTRQLIADKFSEIRVDRVIINATHTHNVPALEVPKHAIISCLHNQHTVDAIAMFIIR